MLTKQQKKDNLQKFLHTKCNELGISHAELARRLGITSSSIFAWFAGRVLPTEESLESLCNVLDVDIQDVIGSDNCVATEKPEMKKQLVPVISWVQAGMWNDRQDDITDVEEWVNDLHPYYKECYALKIKGNSMQALTGLSLPEGSTVVVRPIKNGNPKDYKNKIVIATKNDQATIKELCFDCEIPYLRALNPNYPTIPVDETVQIIGEVVSCTINLK